MPFLKFNKTDKYFTKKLLIITFSFSWIVLHEKWVLGIYYYYRTVSAITDFI